MKLTRVVPLTSLAVVTAIFALGPLFDGPEGAEQWILPAELDLPDVDLGLGEQRLQGRLVDSNGEPVPDAGITTEQAGRPVWTWSASDGTFELRELKPGPLTLRVVALDFEATLFGVEIEDGAPQDAATVTELVLDRRIGPPPVPPELVLGDLTGRVLFGPGAAPQRGYEILAQPTTPAIDPDGGFPRRAAVAEDGSFQIDLLHAGDYRVILLSPDDRGGIGPDLLAGPDGEGRLFSHDVGGDTPRLELVSTMATVVGTVLRPPGPEADPAASTTNPAERARPAAVRGALVRIEARRAESEESEDRTAFLFRAVQSDPEGRFELSDLPPGEYVIQVVAGRQRTSVDLDLKPREVATIPITLPD